MRVAIAGTGGHGREAAWIAAQKDYTVVAFLDELRSGVVNGIPILHPEGQTNYPVICAIGKPKQRRNFVAKYPLLYLDEGRLIFPGVIITVDTSIGKHVHINAGATISHDAVLEDYVTIGPGVTICGNVHIGEAVDVGAGSTVIQGIKIGRGAVIGAGAVVIRDVPEDTVYVGVPAKYLRGA